MAHRFEENSIIIDGFENGIGDSPYSGFTDMRNAEIVQEAGEVSVAFASAAVTLPPVANAVAYTAAASTNRLTVASTTGYYEGCCISLASNTATGLSNSTPYYVRNISGLTFQVSLYPASAIIDITADGGGTLTTYQYGNQRGNTNNGAPVSYCHAPEIGGTLLVDSSNYVWLWQQTSNGNSPINTLLFLRHTTGIAASTDNQVGISYWNGYVVLVQQPSVVNFLSWLAFPSYSGGDWDISNDLSLETITATLTFSAAAASRFNLTRFNPSGTAMPQLVLSDTLYEAASASTLTSSTIKVNSGDVIILWTYTLNNQALNGATFNSLAMTALSSGNGTSPFNYGNGVFVYTAVADTEATIVVDFGAAVTNRSMSYVVMRGLSATSPSISTSSETSLVTATRTRTRDRPNEVAFFFVFTNNSSVTESSMSAGFVSLENTYTAAVGTDWLFYYGEGHGASTTLKGNVPITVAENNTLYWGDGENAIASLNRNPGYTFNPAVADSFVYNWEALDIPDNEIVQSIKMQNSTLFIGADSKNIYPWDTISPSFDEPISLVEPAVVGFTPANNLLYTFCGNLGRIYLTNSSSVELYKELPNSITSVERPFFFFWDANVGKTELYFTFQAYSNSAPTTALDANTGVWAINSDTGALRMVQSTLLPNAWVRMVLPVADGYTQGQLRPPGQGLLVGYSVGSNYYLDYSTSDPHTDYDAYVDTEIISVGSYFNQQTFQHIEYKLGAPMVAGEGIKIYQRSNLDATFILIAEFTEAGKVSDQASVNWENVQWLQFRVEMKSTASSPSYVRLRGLRLL